MRSIFTITRFEIKNLIRDRLFYLLFSVFALMSLVSSLIGWSTYRTTTAVYDAAVRLSIAQSNVQLSGNPITEISSLASFRNIIIYIFLIGSLLGIIIGNRSFIRERKSGILPLILTRPVSESKLIIGKIIGMGLTIFGIISFTLLINLISSYFLPLRHLNTTEITRLLVFYLYSFFYLLFFSFIGFLFAIISKSESLSLFIPVCIWVGISFVMPELITGQTPTALLNPITMDQQLSPGGFFTTMRIFLSPISLGSHYTNIGSQLLSATSSNISLKDIIPSNFNGIALLLISALISFFLCFYELKKYNSVNDFVNE